MTVGVGRFRSIIGVFWGGGGEIRIGGPLDCRAAKRRLAMTRFLGPVDRFFFLCPARGCGVHWWVNLSASPSPYSDLAVVIRAVRGSVGGWVGLRLLDSVLGLLLFGRLGRICGQIERLCQRFQAGRLWRMPARAVVAGPRVSQARVALRWPARFGWLLRAAAWRAAVYGGQLRVILEQPEMVALLRASPQAGRILRPLCRMLAVETALLRPRLEGDPEISVAPKVVKVRVRRARVPIDFGRIPLPRGVLSAARRAGFGKLR